MNLAETHLKTICRYLRRLLIAPSTMLSFLMILQQAEAQRTAYEQKRNQTIQDQDELLQRSRGRLCALHCQLISTCKSTF